MLRKQRKTGPAVVRSALFAGLGLLALTPAVAGQEARPRLSGLLLTPGSGVPVEGAHVRLVNQADSVVAEVLSDARGAFNLLKPPAGVYRLRVARIGYESWASDTLHVDWSAESRMLRLEVPVQAIPLPELLVSEENVCPTTPEERERAFALYESVLPILATVSHTEDLGSLRMRMVRPRKEYYGGGTYRFQRDTVTVVVGKSLYNASPEHLVAHGYAAVVDTMTTFFAPDGDALAAPGFLATHCLRPVEGEDEATVGLGFEPKPGREDVVDVDGVLWIDTITGGPRELEFRYTSVRSFLREHLEPALRLWIEARHGRVSFGKIQIRDESRFGGVLHFQRVARDRWLIHEWRIRRPVLLHRGYFAARSRGNVTPVAYPLEFSGEILTLLLP